jgi:hypothetical protein
MAIQIQTLKNFIDGEFVNRADGETEPAQGSNFYLMQPFSMIKVV